MEKRKGREVRSKTKGIAGRGRGSKRERERKMRAGRSVDGKIQMYR